MTEGRGGKAFAQSVARGGVAGDEAEEREFEIGHVSHGDDALRAFIVRFVLWDKCTRHSRVFIDGKPVRLF